MRSIARYLAPKLHAAALNLWTRYPEQLTVGKRPACITIKADGPHLHNRDRGWQNGAMYGDMAPGAPEKILGLMKAGYSVVVRSQRTDQQAVANWLIKYGIPAVADDGEPRAYWTDTTRVLCTPRAITSACEISPYAYRPITWDETDAYIRAEIRTAAKPQAGTQEEGVTTEPEYSAEDLAAIAAEAHRRIPLIEFDTNPDNEWGDPVHQGEAHHKLNLMRILAKAAEDGDQARVRTLLGYSELAGVWPTQP